MRPNTEILPALPPELPEGVVTFDSIDFGGYCARGYNPNQISGVIRRLPIAELYRGQWLGVNSTGTSGSVFIFRDQEGKELGRAYKPSRSVIHEFCGQGQWPRKLIFTRTQEAEESKLGRREKPSPALVLTGKSTQEQDHSRNRPDYEPIPQWINEVSTEVKAAKMTAKTFPTPNRRALLPITKGSRLMK